ncbi:altered inheritance of mitochondria protein 9, mitochondrial [[Candida] jaroonii]|uniref:Altered inheritance of mitochondria protein 9, mitochondrial n=1 Tax=[Candida] jaroonii TaxID=467808 RepID=A0ACA9YDU6_9ASCO|nr:altered inheritance of mitochondria protein 9, mitochondrial [[Candida] jaroonii]
MLRLIRLPKRLPIRPVLRSVRYISAQPSEHETKISDTSDPNRSKFFQYSWGTWLKNDKIEKAKRQTKFSIEGSTTLIKELQNQFSTSENSDDKKFILKKPTTLNDGSILLSNNLDLIGEGELRVKTISSIHEGKHHRVYKLTLSNDKELVLRIPYKLESDYGISNKIKSEVATLDFLRLKLDLNVPRVLSYGTDKSNALQSPYILMEFIPGDLLMKQWEPLIPDEMPESKEKLLDVIKPISQFQSKVNSITFNKFGSLYFTDDVEGSLQIDLPYEGETDEILQNRWRIGPSVEKCFLKNKNKLTDQQVNKFNGPWSKDQPEQLIVDVANIELENLRTRLGRKSTDSSHKVENEYLLKEAIETFENLKIMAPLLINKSSENIPNVGELFKPRLYLPDLDPLNVITSNHNKNFFLDFEYSTIKPFIFTSYPQFINYSGFKIYDLEQDVENYNELDDVEKEQYKYMYYRTRDERLWEIELNNNNHELIAIASPHIKMLKSPYIQSLDYKNDRDYLYVEGSIIQIRGVWEAYVTNKLSNSEDIEFPIKYSDDFLMEFQSKIQEYQAEISSAPFAATDGWVPQDMFDQLNEQGLIIEDKDGYVFNTEKILEDGPKN